MLYSPNNIYHIYNQGNNRQRIFFERRDYLIFLTLYKRLFPAVCSTIAWCLMPNHFHFMVHTDERCNARIRQGGIYLDPISNSIRKSLSGYARIFNTLYAKTGSIFRQKTKAKCLSGMEIFQNSPYLVEDYYINCFHYIHQNPLKAKLVDKLEDWEFSSFRDYAGLRDGSLCRKDLAALYCGYKAENFIEKSNEMVEKKIVGFFS